MGTYIFTNQPAPTVAAPTPFSVAASSVRTLIQVAAASTSPLIVVEYGVSFNYSAAGAAFPVELFTTTTANTTMATTALAPQAYLRGTTEAGTTTVTMGAALTGTNSTAADATTPANPRYGDFQLVAPSNQYVKQFPLGREFFVPGGTFLKIRVSPTVTLSCYAYVIFQDM